MDSWFLKLLPRDINQQTTNQQTVLKNHRKIKNNRKVKAMGNISSTMGHYPKNGWMGDTDP